MEAGNKEVSQMMNRLDYLEAKVTIMEEALRGLFKVVAETATSWQLIMIDEIVVKASKEMDKLVVGVKSDD